MSDANRVLDYWINTSFTLTSGALAGSALSVSPEDNARICGAPEDAFPVQFILSDTLREAKVDLTGCEGGLPVFLWGGCQDFAAGDKLVFKWTSTNVARICPCPEDSEGEGETGGSGGGTGGGSSVGTNDTKQLAPTGVVPGNYGGLIVNECGQITQVEPDFPAVPVFDSCCD